MTRRKKQPRKPWQRRAGSSEQFTQLYHDLLDSEAFHDLTPKQKTLYLYCVRESHGRATADDLSHDERLFYFNRALQTTVHKLYSPSDGRGFERDMAALIGHGFVDSIKSGYAARERNLYRLSDRWGTWGTAAYSVPDGVMTTHMLIERRKHDE